MLNGLMSNKGTVYKFSSDEPQRSLRGDEDGRVRGWCPNRLNSKELGNERTGISGP